MKSYTKIVKQILSLQNYERNTSVPYQSKTFDLDQFCTFMEKLGGAHHRIKSILVGGTSGKGSTAVMLQEILSSSGYKVGLFTSPHLISLRERISINNKIINKRDFVYFAEQIFSSTDYVDKLSNKGIRTFFEFFTALSIIYFEAHEVDIAIFEVGVGGRLDSTNCLDAILSIITSIGIDHTHWLGKTLENIAREKSGIIKKGKDVITSAQNEEIISVINKTAHQKKAKLHIESVDFSIKHPYINTHGTNFSYISRNNDFDDIFIPLVGIHQSKNAGLAICAMECLREYGFDYYPKDILSGLNSAKLEGRFQQFSVSSPSVSNIRNIILDGAHNIISTEALVMTVKKLYPKKRILIIFGVVKDKEYQNMVSILKTLSEEFIFTELNTPRSQSAEKLAELFPARNSIIVEKSVISALKVAIKKSSKSDIILITGSFYLLGEILQILGNSFEFTLHET